MIRRKKNKKQKAKNGKVYKYLFLCYKEPLSKMNTASAAKKMFLLT